MSNEFPQEHLIELSGISPFLVGRIQIFKQYNLFNVEIDIIQVESGKIHNHVKSLYNQDDARDALDSSVQVLKNYLDQIKH
jgi:hypothetical protein